jgi:lipopolysaccharide export system protein LptA
MRAASRLLIALCFLPTLAFAQGSVVAFGALEQDTSLPVEITADSLTVNQTDGTAVFEGNVVAIQGEMRLASARIEVMYQDGGTGIETLRALGGVTVVSATDAAESSEALYTVATGDLVMTGNVLLTQGQNTITGERLVVDLEAGTGRMEGRVQTVFTPATKPAAEN